MNLFDKPEQYLRFTLANPIFSQIAFGQSSKKMEKRDACASSFRIASHRMREDDRIRGICLEHFFLQRRIRSCDIST